MAAPLRTVAAAAGDPLAEAIALTRRLKLPHIRRTLPDLVPTAKAQRWDPAEVVRVLLAGEAAGRWAGSIGLAIPKLRAGSYFPDWLLERRCRARA